MIRRLRSSSRRARPSPLAIAAVSTVEAIESRVLLSTVAPAYAAQIGLTGVVAASTSFEDNFDGTALDKTKWEVRDGYRWRAYKDAPVSTFSYTDTSSIVVGGGALQLVAHNDPVTGQLKGAYLQSGTHFDDSSVGSPVPAAKLTPGYSGSFEQAYGYWETRAKFSSLPGEWASFWVHSYKMVDIRDDATKINQPAVYGTEMDVVEHSSTRGGVNSVNDVSMLDHYNGYGAYAKTSGVYPTTTTLAPQKAAPSAYHVYGLLWTPTSVKFYIDGTLTNTITDPAAISKVPQMAMLSVEVGAPGSLEPGKGSNFFGSTPAGGYGSVASSQARATFDYVRVWPLAGATTTPTPAPTPVATTGTVRGTVFLDANANGKRDAAEVGDAGVRIFADYNNDGAYESGEPVATTIADGTYSLAGLRVGVNTAIFVVPTGGQTQTLPAMRTATIVGKYWETLAAGQTVAGVDFGVNAGNVTTTPTTPPTTTPTPTTGSVTGTAFLDANGNGKRDAGEVARAGVRIFADSNKDGLYESGEPVATTAANGTYTLAGVRAGVSTGILTVATSGQTQTLPVPKSASVAGEYWVTLTAGQTLAAIDFGVKVATTPVAPTPPAVTTGTVTGSVFLDANGNAKRDSAEAARAGVRVFADYNNNNFYDAGEPVATSAADGTFTLAGLRVGTSTAILTVATAGQTQTAPTPAAGALVGKYLETLKAGQTVTNLVFGIKLGGGGTGVSSLGGSSLGGSSLGGSSLGGSSSGLATLAVATPALATVAGTTFLDANANGRRDATEAVLAGVRVFADYDNDNVFDAGEPVATTDASGRYTL